MNTLSRRRFMAVAGAALAVPQPASGAARRPGRAEALVLNDASRLNPVPVARNALLRGTCIAAVMLFPQAMTAEAEESMRRITEKLIDRVLALGGSYYLPYRLHARPDQLRAAYPRIEEFVQKKRSYDPGLRFRNVMWERYFA